MFLVKTKGLSDMCFCSTQYESVIMKMQPKSSKITEISTDIIRPIRHKRKPPRISNNQSHCENSLI